MTAEFRYDENEMKEVASKALNDYYAALLEKIDNLDLRDVLKKKNPYLYRAKGMEKAADIVAALVDAYISSSEETIFGNSFFAAVAIALVDILIFSFGFLVSSFLFILDNSSS